MASSKLSFTIRRPTPVSRSSSAGPESDVVPFKVPAIPRHVASATTSANSSKPGSPSPLGRDSGSPAPPPRGKRAHHDRDSSDEEAGEFEDELVTGFDQFGVQRLHAKPEPSGPLVIPALKNRDWRDVARKRKQIYLPPSAQAATGEDGSVGGLGTRDTINSGPQLSGLQFAPQKKPRLDEDGDEDMQGEEENDSSPDGETQPEAEETEDQRALRAVLASAQNGDDSSFPSGLTIDTIPLSSSTGSLITEQDAYKQDVASLPDQASLEDYERVPVSQFGAALLRGMGWKEGEVASKSKRFQGQGQNGKKGLIEPWIPTARPALLGIGAKEKEVLDDGSGTGKNGKGKGRKQAMGKYMPLVRADKDGSSEDVGRDRDRDREESGGKSGSSSRRRSPSPSSDRDRRRDRDWRDKDYDRDRGRYNSGDGRNKDRRKDGEGRRDKGDRDKDRDREHDNDSSSRRDKDRDRNREHDRRRDRSPDRERDGERDRERRKDKDRRGY